MQDTGQGVCQPPSPACGADGELCADNPDCCAGAVCAAEPPSAVHRCQVALSDASCRPDGNACALPQECCGGHCIELAGTTLVCASMCVADGNGCTSDADCCDNVSGCQSVRGSLVCGSLAP
jgi:hypothetical protein